MNNKVIVLGGGADQIALINELHRRGKYTILIDYFENPPACSIANEHIRESTLDVIAVKRIAVEKKATLIVTACTDQALLTMAKVSEELSLPTYISYKTALLVTNKSYMKNLLYNNNIPTAKYIIVESPTDELLETLCYPLVVKPVDSNSSKGVKRVHLKSDIKDAIHTAMSFSRTHKAIVEEYKEGEEISADFYIEGKRVKLLSVTNSIKICNTNNFTIIKSIYPVEGVDEIQILSIAQRIADVFNLENCPLLIQMIQNKDGDYFVIEFSARIGGGSKYYLIETISGVNIMSVYVDRLLEIYTPITPKSLVNYAQMVFLYCRNGVIKKFYGFEKLKKNSVILDYFLYKSVGMSIEKVENSSDRAAGVLIIGNTIEELNEKVALTKSVLRVENEEGDNILRIDLI